MVRAEGSRAYAYGTDVTPYALEDEGNIRRSGFFLSLRPLDALGAQAALVPHVVVRAHEPRARRQLVRLSGAARARRVRDWHLRPV